MFGATIFRGALEDPQFIFESASSVFMHHFILVKCSLTIADLDARTKVELQKALEDTQDSQQGLCSDFDYKKGRKEGAWMLIG